MNVNHLVASVPLSPYQSSFLVRTAAVRGEAQWVEAYLVKPAQSPAFSSQNSIKSGIEAVYICNPNTQDVKAED